MVTGGNAGARIISLSNTATMAGLPIRYGLAGPARVCRSMLTRNSSSRESVSKCPRGRLLPIRGVTAVAGPQSRFLRTSCPKSPFGNVYG